MKMKTLKKVKPKMYQCSTCYQKFAQYASAKKHCITTFKSAICSICGAKIPQAKNLRRHIRNNHEKTRGERVKPTKEIPKCHDCGISFSRRHKYKEHMRNKHNMEMNNNLNKEVLNCPECDFQNTSVSRMKAHFTIVHSVKPPKFKCSSCEFVCKSSDGVLKHTRRVHTSVSKNARTVDHGFPPQIPEISNLHSTVLSQALVVQNLAPALQTTSLAEPALSEQASLTPAPQVQTQLRQPDEQSTVSQFEGSWEEYKEYMNLHSYIITENVSKYFDL